MPRIGLFADIDDLRRFSVAAFGASGDEPIGAMALARAVAGPPGGDREVVEVSLHRTARRRPGGRPDAYALLDARAWRSEDPRVRASLAVGPGTSRHGVPIAVSIDALLAVAERRCDVAIVAGHDADLAPALEAVRGRGGPGAAEALSWSAPGFDLAIPAATRPGPRVHRLDRAAFQRVVQGGRAARLDAYQVPGDSSEPPADGTQQRWPSAAAHPHPASSGARGVPFSGDVRVGVFVDYRDLVDAAADAFPGSVTRAEFSPMELARRVVAGTGSARRTLALVSVHDARPLAQLDRAGYVAVGARATRWREEDSRVRVTLRRLRTLSGGPAAKGVATALALDAVMALERGACDVAVLASGDADLRAAVTACCRRYAPRSVELASWWTRGHRRSVPRQPGVWHHRLGPEDWAAVRLG